VCGTCVGGSVSTSVGVGDVDVGPDELDEGVDAGVGTVDDSLLKFMMESITASLLLDFNSILFVSAYFCNSNKSFFSSFLLSSSSSFIYFVCILSSISSVGKAVDFFLFTELSLIFNFF
jgi:hypothetical protein